jgi:Leucine-rich repeat (LRR) protein
MSADFATVCLDPNALDPVKAQTAKVLLRSQRTKDPVEAAQTLVGAGTLDISRDQWAAGGPPLSFGFLEHLPQLKTLKADFQRVADPLAADLVWARPWKVLSLRGFTGASAQCRGIVAESGDVLEELDLGSCDVCDVEVLARCKTLRVLSLSKVSLKDASFLSGLTSLESLDLSENNLARIPDLGANTRLRTFKIFRNMIADLAPLAALKKLRLLDVSENGVSDLTPLEGLRDLQTLRFARNSVRTIRALKGLDLLETVSLALNPVAEDEIDDVLRRRIRIE